PRTAAAHRPEVVGLVGAVAGRRVVHVHGDGLAAERAHLPRRAFHDAPALVAGAVRAVVADALVDVGRALRVLQPDVVAATEELVLHVLDVQAVARLALEPAL